MDISIKDGGKNAEVNQTAAEATATKLQLPLCSSCSQGAGLRKYGTVSFTFKRLGFLILRELGAALI